MMYVDKVLAGGKAVQTPSRLNRTHPKTQDVSVLDFMNDAHAIQESFAPNYRTTILADGTDPNKLYAPKATLAANQLYAGEDVNELVSLSTLVPTVRET